MPQSAPPTPKRFLLKEPNLVDFLLVLLAAEGSLLLSQTLFGLIYKRFVWNLAPPIQAGILALAIAIWATFRKINRRLDKRLPWSESLSKRFIIQLLVQISAVLALTWIIRLSYRLFFAGHDSAGYGFVRLRDEAIISAVVVLFTALLVLIQLGIFLLHQWKKSELEAEQFKKENLEFRFDRLKNQVNPHFLFNSLNTLASLVYKDQDKASSFIRQMAKVYRYVLENRDKEIVSLAEELTFLEGFISLVKIRFEEALFFENDIEEAFLDRCIPPMTLQLLIENALKHNIVSPSKPLTVKIFVQDDYLIVQNNLQLKLTPEISTKTGLENIRNRYGFLTRKPVRVQNLAQIFQVEVPLL